MEGEKIWTKNRRLLSFLISYSLKTNLLQKNERHRHKASDLLLMAYEAQKAHSESYMCVVMLYF